MFFDITHLWPYVLVVLSLVASPGPDSVLIVRNTLGSGVQVGLAAVAGVQVGLGLHTLLAITGISLIIRSSVLLFSVLVVVGSLYLCWLGIQAFIRPGGLINIQGRKSSGWRSFRDALVTNAFNPKAVVLFLAVMPGFVIPEAVTPTFWQLVSLALLLLVINSIWQIMLAYSADFLGKKLASPGFTNWVNRISGSFLFFFGVLLFVENIDVF